MLNRQKTGHLRGEIQHAGSVISLFGLVVAIFLAWNPQAQASDTAETGSSSAFSPERMGGPFGIGVALGDLDGISLKYWLTDVHALHLRVGSSFSIMSSAGLEFTYEYHFRPVQAPDNAFSLPFYVGGGTCFSVASTTSTYVDGGVITVAGMSILVPNLPVELFFELRPAVVLYNPVVGTGMAFQVGFIMEGGLGAHYYF